MHGAPFSEVVCIDDVLELGLPVGEVGVIIQTEKDPEKALRYLVRFAQYGYTAWCTARDLIAYKYYLKQRATKELAYSLAHTRSLPEQDILFAMQELEQVHFAEMGWGWSDSIDEDFDEDEDFDDDFEEDEDYFEEDDNLSLG